MDLGDIQKALTRTITTTGKAVMINTIAVMMGFAVLTLSEFHPIRLFGFLMSITMIISAWGAVTVYPALVIVLKPKFLFRKNGKN
jgi:predicted RND superfamily exporter protein